MDLQRLGLNLQCILNCASTLFVDLWTVCTLVCILEAIIALQKKCDWSNQYWACPLIRKGKLNSAHGWVHAADPNCEMAQVPVAEHFWIGETRNLPCRLRHLSGSKSQDAGAKNPWARRLLDQKARMLELRTPELGDSWICWVYMKEMTKTHHFDFRSLSQERFQVSPASLQECSAVDWCYRERTVLTWHLCVGTKKRQTWFLPELMFLRWHDAYTGGTVTSQSSCFWDGTMPILVVQWPARACVFEMARCLYWWYSDQPELVFLRWYDAYTGDTVTSQSSGVPIHWTGLKI